MLRHTTASPQPATPGARGTTTALSVVGSRTERQSVLGDDQAAGDRQLALQEEVEALLVSYGDEGPNKPKRMLNFTRNVQYKRVGGQQLQAECMFCGLLLLLTSTGATRIVDHFAMQCVLCPTSVAKPCKELRARTDVKRERKDEHVVLVKEEQDQVVRVLKAQKKELRREGIKSGFKN